MGILGCVVLVILPLLLMLFLISMPSASAISTNCGWTNLTNVLCGGAGGVDFSKQSVDTATDTMTLIGRIQVSNNCQPLLVVQSYQAATTATIQLRTKSGIGGGCSVAGTLNATLNPTYNTVAIGGGGGGNNCIKNLTFVPGSGSQSLDLSGNCTGVSPVFSQANGSNDYVGSIANNGCPVDFVTYDSTTGKITYFQVGQGGAFTQALPSSIANSYPATCKSDNGTTAKFNANGGAGSGQTPDNCPISTWGLRWLVCPIITQLDSVVKPLNDILQAELTYPLVNFDTTKQPGSAFFAAWSGFRDVAVSLLVMAALVMIIAQALGFQVLDAYSIRKLLPRLLIGAIALTLSWPLMEFVTQFFNDIMNWIGDVIIYPFQGLGPAVQPTDIVNGILNQAGIAVVTTAEAVAIGTAVFIFGIPGILAIVGSLVLALFVAFVTLTIRMIILIIVIIAAPLAIAAYILPGTQFLYKVWRDAALAVYTVQVIIALMLAGGQVMERVAAKQSGPAAILAPLAAIIVYFMFGTAFRLAGGALAAASGAINNFHGGAFKRLRDFRGHQAQSNWQNAQAGQRFQGRAGLTRWLNPIAQSAALAPGARFRPSRIRARQANLIQSTAAGMEEKNEAFKAIKSDDTKLWALMETTGAGKSLSGRGDSRQDVISSLQDHGFKGTDRELNLAADEVMEAKRAGGNGQSLLRAATMAQAATGTGFGRTHGTMEEAAGDMLQWIDASAGNDLNAASNMLAGMRSSAVNSGRGDLGGGGFGDMLGAFAYIRNGKRAQAQALQLQARGARLTPEQQAALRGPSLREATNKVLDSANEGTRQALLATGKPYSAGNLARRRAEVFSQQLENLNDMHDSVTAGDGRFSQEQLEASRRNVKQELASMMGEYDALGQESKLNAQSVADGMFGVSLTSARGLGLAGFGPRGGSTGTVLDLANSVLEQEQTPGFAEPHHFEEMRKDFRTGAASTMHAAAAAAAAGPAAAPPSPAGPI